MAYVETKLTDRTKPKKLSHRKPLEQISSWDLACQVARVEDASCSEVSPMHNTMLFRMLT